MFLGQAGYTPRLKFQLVGYNFSRTRVIRVSEFQSKIHSSRDLYRKISVTRYTLSLICGSSMETDGIFELSPEFTVYSHQETVIVITRIVYYRTILIK